MKTALLIFSFLSYLSAFAQNSDEAKIIQRCLEEITGPRSQERTIEVQIANSLAPFVREIKTMDIKLVSTPTDDSILIEIIRQHTDTFQVKTKKHELNSCFTIVQQEEGWKVWTARQDLIPRQ